MASSVDGHVRHGRLVLELALECLRGFRGRLPAVGDLPAAPKETSLMETISLLMEIQHLIEMVILIISITATQLIILP